MCEGKVLMDNCFWDRLLHANNKGFKDYALIKSEIYVLHISEKH